jgi:signal transduction histidine kinase
LRDVLASHQVGLLLLQGQVFFVLGFSILFLTRGGVRLELARELGALAVFGFCEAVAAWCAAWLAYSGASAIWLDWLRIAVMGLGYAALLTFALQVTLPTRNGGWGRCLVGAAILLVWGTSLLAGRLAGLSGERMRLVGEIAARYGMALPGGVVGAWGLRRETYRTIKPDRFLPLVKPPMRVTEVALAAFALFGGVLGPTAGFFPASLLNESAVLAATGVPVSVFRALAGVGMAFGVARALDVVLNEIELWLEGVEQMQALVAERERIGRDLHDGIIQSIYASGLILEGARQNLVQSPAAARQQVTTAIENLNETIHDIRRYIFDLRGEIPQEDLDTALRRLLRDFQVNTLLETSLVVVGRDRERRRLDPEKRQHVLQIAREALANAARHARATEVMVRMTYGAHHLRLRIADDGIGLASLPDGDGHGLRNMRERARLLNGELTIDTAPGRGLTVTVTVPYTQRVGCSP